MFAPTSTASIINTNTGNTSTIRTARQFTALGNNGRISPTPPPTAATESFFSATTTTNNQSPKKKLANYLDKIDYGNLNIQDLRRLHHNASKDAKNKLEELNIYIDTIKEILSKDRLRTFVVENQDGIETHPFLDFQIELTAEIRKNFPELLKEGSKNFEPLKKMIRLEMLLIEYIEDPEAQLERIESLIKNIQTNAVDTEFANTLLNAHNLFVFYSSIFTDKIAPRTNNESTNKYYLSKLINLHSPTSIIDQAIKNIKLPIIFTESVDPKTKETSIIPTVQQLDLKTEMSLLEFLVHETSDQQGYESYVTELKYRLACLQLGQTNDLKKIQGIVIDLIMYSSVPNIQRAMGIITKRLNVAGKIWLIQNLINKTADMQEYTSYRAELKYCLVCLQLQTAHSDEDVQQIQENMKAVIEHYQQTNELPNALKYLQKQLNTIPNNTIFSSYQAWLQISFDLNITKIRNNITEEIKNKTVDNALDYLNKSHLEQTQIPAQHKWMLDIIIELVDKAMDAQEDSLTINATIEKLMEIESAQYANFSDKLPNIITRTLVEQEKASLNILDDECVRTSANPQRFEQYRNWLQYDARKQVIESQLDHLIDQKKFPDAMQMINTLIPTEDPQMTQWLNYNAKRRVMEMVILYDLNQARKRIDEQLKITPDNEMNTKYRDWLKKANELVPQQLFNARTQNLTRNLPRT